MVNEILVPDEVIRLRELNARMESVDEWAEHARSKALSKFKKETIYVETQEMPRRHKLREISKKLYDARLQEIDDTVDAFKLAWRKIRETLNDDVILGYTAVRWNDGMIEGRKLAQARVAERLSRSKLTE